MAYFLRTAPAQRVHASVSAIVSVCLTHRTRRTSFECAFKEMLTMPLTPLPTNRGSARWEQGVTRHLPVRSHVS